MSWPVQCTIRALAWVLLTAILFYGMEILLSTFPTTWHFAKYSMFILGADVGYTVPFFNLIIILSNVSRLCALHMDDRKEMFLLGQALLAVAVRNLTKLVSLKVTLLLLLPGNMVVFGVMVGWMIWMGVRRRLY